MFQASLTSAQVLLPGSQASVSSMLLEGHSLLALSTIMFAPGGIDQVGALSNPYNLTLINWKLELNEPQHLPH